MTHKKLVRSEKSTSMKVSNSGEKTDYKTVRSENRDSPWMASRIIRAQYRIFSHAKAAIASLYLLCELKASLHAGEKSEFT